MDRPVDNSDNRAATSAAPPATGTTGVSPVDRPAWRKFLSHDSGAFAQFIKYGVIGVMATCVLAATCLRCLTADDWAVRLLGLPSAAFTGEEAWYASRGMLAAAATAVGFVFANIFCWLMNRWFVFRPGKFRWYVELGMFFGASTLATVIALGVMKFLIDQFNMMTTLAVVVEVVVSFLVNFFIRKFFIFKG